MSHDRANEMARLQAVISEAQKTLVSASERLTQLVHETERDLLQEPDWKAICWRLHCLGLLPTKGIEVSSYTEDIGKWFHHHPWQGTPDCREAFLGRFLAQLERVVQARALWAVNLGHRAQVEHDKYEQERTTLLAMFGLQNTHNHRDD